MSTEAQEPNRLLFVDTLRGLGVVFMVQLHTSHGWLRPEARSGELWSAAQFFGGLAAPVFLILAGTSLGMQWGRAIARRATLQAGKHIARALQLIVLGYALRLQMWIVDAGGYARPANYLAIASLCAAYFLMHSAAGRLVTAPRRAASLAAVAASLWALGLGFVHLYDPVRVRGLVRIDILQCIGASLVILNLVALAHRGRAPTRGSFVALTLLAGLASAWLRTHVPRSWPEPLAGYLTQFPTPDGVVSGALFPVFPWLGFASAGAALGLHWTQARDSEQLETRVIAGVALGACMALLVSEAWPPVYKLTHQAPWLAPTLRLLYKIGLVMVLAGAAFALARFASPLRGALQTFGRASLLVYWAHLEFAFGVAARPVLRRLDFPMWALGTGVLLVAMWAIAALRMGAARGVIRWPQRRPATG